MKITTLNFYEGFSCIGKDCKNSCCEKWKINIDKKSLKRYKHVKGKFGDRLKKGIDYKNAEFKMKNDRCVFLNKDNLCDIYINMGKESLCEICSLHPRYRNFLKSHTELGYGLCCEVVAKKVIDFKDKAKERVYKKGLSFFAYGFEKKLLNKRKEVYSIIQNRRLSLTKRLDRLIDYCGLDRERFFAYDFKAFLLSLEILDGGYRERLNAIDKNLYYNENLIKYATSFEQLSVYFIHRHLVNAVDFLDLKARIAFAIFSVVLIADIFDKNGHNFKANLYDISREFSSEIEYDNENFFSVLSKLEDLLKR